MLFRFFRHWRSSYTGIPRAIWLLALVSLINRIGGMVIPFMTLYLTQDLRFSIEQAGYVMGCFGLGAFVGAYTGGRLTDKFGFYRVQFWSLLMNGVMLLLLMLVRDFPTMCAAVFVLSVISEIFRPANSMSVAANTDETTRTRSISLLRMSFNMGWAVAPALAGFLAEISWDLLFWLDGFTCIGAALMLAFLIPYRKNAKKSSIHGPEEVVATTSPYRDRTYLAFLLYTLLGALVFMQMIWTVPVFLKESYGWTESAIGMIASLNGIIVFAMEMPLIFRIEKSRPALLFVCFGLILYGLSYLAFLIFPPGIAAALVFIVSISMGEIFVMPFSSNFAYGRAGLHGKSGQYMAMYSMAYSLSNILAPLVGTQLIHRFGYHALWFFTVCISAIAMLGFWNLYRRMEKPPAPDLEPMLKTS